MWELPEKFKTARGQLGTTLLDTGDQHVVFLIEQDDWDIANEGQIAGMVIPAEVARERLVYVLDEIRSWGGLRFIIIPQRRKRKRVTGTARAT